MTLVSNKYVLPNCNRASDLSFAVIHNPLELQTKTAPYAMLCYKYTSSSTGGLESPSRRNTSQHLQSRGTAQRPETGLQQPEACAIHPALPILLARNVSVRIDDSAQQPSEPETSRRLRVFQACKEHVEDCLGHIFQEVGVGSLGAVELVGVAAFLDLLRCCVCIWICNLRRLSQ